MFQIDLKEIGEAMRPESLRGEAFRLSREERDHIAGHALDSIGELARWLAIYADPTTVEDEAASSCARKIAALSNLLDNIGWEREAPPSVLAWDLGELFPAAQLRPWLEEWQRQDDEALRNAEEVLEVAKVAVNRCEAEPTAHMAVSDAQTKLGIGAILLARLEKWRASHGN